MLAAKRQDGGLFKSPPYPGYPFIMIPDLTSPYLPNGSLSPTARTVSVFHVFLQPHARSWSTTSMFRDCFGGLVNFCHTSQSALLYSGTPFARTRWPSAARERAREQSRASGECSGTRNVLSWRAQTHRHWNFNLRSNYFFSFSLAGCDCLEHFLRCF